MLLMLLLVRFKSCTLDIIMLLLEIQITKYCHFLLGFNNVIYCFYMLPMCPPWLSTALALRLDHYPRVYAYHHFHIFIIECMLIITFDPCIEPPKPLASEVHYK